MDEFIDLTVQSCGYFMIARSAIKFLLCSLCCLLAVAACATDAIHGKVINQTRHQAAAGDDVVLLRMGEGMQEESRVRTNAQGEFSMHMAQPGARYVVRVMHQGVNYDLQFAGESELQLEVFDAAGKINGLVGTLGMAQLEPDAEALKVTEMYSIRNASVPPVTQSSSHNFVMTLPEGATLDSFAARRAQGIWVNLAPVPVSGNQGRYSVDFPLRPGDTLFKYSYHLPPSSTATFHLKPAYPVRSFAVMHPPEMKFEALRTHTFTSPGVVKGMQVEQAVSKITSEVPAFEVSGIGMAAKAPPASDTATLAIGAATAENPTAQPATNLQNENETEQRIRREAWMIGSLTLLLVGGGLLASWRRGRSGKTTRADQSGYVVQVFKDELLDLEAERSRGSISIEQYDSAKAALSVSMQRAVQRKKA
jgi:hypothetical protein